MRHIRGEDYSWRLNVFKRLRMPVNETVISAEKKRQHVRERELFCREQMVWIYGRYIEVGRVKRHQHDQNVLERVIVQERYFEMGRVKRHQHE